MLIPQVLFKCEKCKDTGWIIGKDNLSMTRCKCQEGEIAKRQWIKRGINPEKSDKTFGNFKVWNDTSMIAKNTATSYYKKFDDIRDSKQNSIIFCGQVGSGKTHLSIALALNFIKKGTNVIYMPYRDVVTALKQNMIDYEYYKREISKYQLAEILLIDDLFKGKVTESDVNIMFEIINYRYLNNLPIIVSTEFIIEKMLNFDEGVGSRIYEMCKHFIVQIEGKENNYRLKA
ncbi:ATPase AAA [Clostridium botulinum]|uniref:ATPase AAA n=2 Tax=Clostridium botulinum TaxID=1491 RepID=A0A9Q1ZC66_CLOBO|nr:ATP-binding protein [Clostridium botulinum]KEI04698.1 ATPase AAA [Clostridium botulinum C/D str. Sp77]KEH97192.1 ATPase AAA [Clostridium botulinum D str. 16868]KLU76932.1 ATPase AAA [Clostridium botulinum V891]KOA75221.1 ATPase AAA [Clostridium botulinum]KOA79001.1 ATPase AAA [Clostridium botulinum]